MSEMVWVEVTQMDEGGTITPVHMTTAEAAGLLARLVLPKAKSFVIAYVVDAETGNTTVIKMTDDLPDDDETKIIDPKELGNGR